MAKCKSLTVHKNTIERQHRKSMQADMVHAAKSMGNQDVVAYALVAFRSDGGAMCHWNTGSIMPMWGFAPTVQEIIIEDMRQSGVDDTWRPSLTERKGRTG